MLDQPSMKRTSSFVPRTPSHRAAFRRNFVIYDTIQLFLNYNTDHFRSNSFSSNWNGRLTKNLSFAAKNIELIVSGSSNKRTKHISKQRKRSESLSSKSLIRSIMKRQRANTEIARVRVISIRDRDVDGRASFIFRFLLGTFPIWIPINLTE